ncbi:MAG TPA: MarR family transcriptional regulator [bacterium]|nr:MarR family transcriptional regulator [bacterium]
MDTAVISETFYYLFKLLNLFKEMENTQFKISNNITVYPGEIHMISAIANSYGINVTEVAARLDTSKSAASQMIKKLVRKGLIEKAHTEQNNKEIRLLLTREGKTALDIVEKRHLELKEKFFSFAPTFSDEKWHNYRDFLSKMIDVIKEILDENRKEEE